ncbi:MAG: hypothetical protein NVS3B26_03220 [Mycobacteriales bacterium]
MSRRRSALLAAAVALLLGATYLLTRRGQPAATGPDASASTPHVPAMPPSPRETAATVAPAADAHGAEALGAEALGAEALEAEAPTAALPAGPAAVAAESSEPPRSWGAGRGVPAHSPATTSEPVAVPRDGAEEALPTWIRAAIVAAALVAFFAVSLIATKQV